MPWHITERGGGAEVQANYLSRELVNRGFSVYYICQSTNKNLVGTTSNIDGVTILWLPNSGKFPWRDQNKYLIALENIKPDLVIQRLTSNVTYVLGKYCKQKNIPLVWVCTDNLNPFRKFHLKKFTDKHTISNTGFLKYMAFRFNAMMMDYYRNKGMKDVSIAFTQNDFQEEMVKKQFHLSSKRMISGHPNPTIEIHPKERFQKKTILWAANMGKHKRPELFVELANSLKDSTINFVMVGGHSDKNYVNEILKNKPNCLINTGQLSFEDALIYFDSATLFVNTSAPGGDGFPNTFIQSWLRGVPILSFGFDPDGVVSKNNLGFSVNSVDEAKKTIEDLFSDQEKFEKLSINVSKYAQENHSIKKMTDNFLENIKK